MVPIYHWSTFVLQGSHCVRMLETPSLIHGTYPTFSLSSLNYSLIDGFLKWLRAMMLQYTLKTGSAQSTLSTRNIMTSYIMKICKKLPKDCLLKTPYIFMIFFGSLFLNTGLISHIYFWFQFYCHYNASLLNIKPTLWSPTGEFG